MKKTLGVVAIIKNEGLYILEWLAHYRSLGVKNIILYDNESDDGSSDLLQKLANHGLITRVPWSVSEGTSPQLSAYSDAISRFDSEFEFIAFFDADEFLATKLPINIEAWLGSLATDVSAIAINQRVFGSAGEIEYRPEPVILRFQKASESTYVENQWVKSIVRPSRVSKILNPHRFVISAGKYLLPNGSSAFESADMSGIAASIDHSMFQLNHYILKSRQEFLKKQIRGGGAASTRQGRLQRYSDMAFFEGRDALISRTVDTLLADRWDVVSAQLLEIQAQIER